MKHIALLASIFSFSIHAAALAAPPRLLPFQGRLTDASGAPVADGAKVVQFKIYDAPTGGNALWPGEVQKLTINGGLVSTLLGSKASLDAVDFNQALYLEITVDANTDNQITQADPPLLPRQSILPAVFAVEVQSAWDSAKLNGADWSAVFDNGNPNTGRISIDRVALSTGSLSASVIAANDAIGASQLAPNSVESSEIKDGAVTTAKIADGEVKAADIAESAVTFAKTAPRPMTIGSAAQAGAVSVTEFPSFTGVLSKVYTSESFTTSGRPVFLGLTSDGKGQSGFIQAFGVGGYDAYANVSFKLVSTGAVIYRSVAGRRSHFGDSQIPWLMVPISSFWTMLHLPPGTHQIQVLIDSEANDLSIRKLDITPFRLIIFEL